MWSTGGFHCRYRGKYYIDFHSDVSPYSSSTNIHVFDDVMLSGVLGNHEFRSGGMLCVCHYAYLKVYETFQTISIDSNDIFNNSIL